MRMNPAFAEYGLKELLPLKLDLPDEGCTRTNRSQLCFEAGNSNLNIFIFFSLLFHARLTRVFFPFRMTVFFFSIFPHVVYH